MVRPVSRTAKVVDGQLVFENAYDRQQLKNSLRLFSSGTQVRITVEEFDDKREEEEKRTLKQNKYYHKLIELIAEETGYTHDEAHLEMKCKFLSSVHVNKDGEFKIVGSTRDLTTKTFTDYIERIFAWASSELNLVLPNPNEF